MSTNFWSDKYIECLIPIHKLVYIYLFTNEASNTAGVYQIKKSRISDDTGIDIDSLLVALETLIADKKIIYRDNWLLAVNTLKNQVLTNYKIGLNIAQCLRKVPDFIKDYIDTDSLSIAYEYLIHRLNKNKNKNKDKNNSKSESECYSIYSALKILEKFGAESNEGIPAPTENSSTVDNGINSKTLTDYYSQQYLEFNQKAYPIDFPRDRKIMKNLLPIYPLVELKSYITVFVKPEYKMWNDKKDIPSFKTEVEKIARSTGKENKVKFMPEVL